MCSEAMKRAPVLLVGDSNSCGSSAGETPRDPTAFQLFQRGVLPLQSRFMASAFGYETVKGSEPNECSGYVGGRSLSSGGALALQHGVQLACPYDVLGHPPKWTTYTDAFQGRLDMLEASVRHFDSLSCLLPPATDAVVGRYGGMPHPLSGSDHQAIAGCFRIKAASQ